MKRNLFLGTIALLLSSPLPAQTVKELQRQLAEKEAENQQLRQRIEVLERELTPRRIKQSAAPPAAGKDDRNDSNRALERALVRERGLLLPPGRFELEPNFVYSYSDNAAASFRRESFGPGLALRAGLPWRSQFEASLPYVFERRRDGSDSTHSDGIGDLDLNISHQLLSEGRSVPDLIGTLGYQASTGKNTLFESGTPVAHGTGFNAVYGAVNAVKRVDPLVYFGGYRFTHNFSDTKNGVKVDLGDAHELRLGTALATGPDTSLRAALNLTYFSKTSIGGVALQGSDDRSAVFEFGGSVVLTESTALDVLVGAGLTRNAPDVRITVAVPIRY